MNNVLQFELFFLFNISFIFGETLNSFFDMSDFNFHIFYKKQINKMNQNESLHLFYS